jgi:hypothetical protein
MFYIPSNVTLTAFTRLNQRIAATIFGRNGDDYGD